MLVRLIFFNLLRKPGRSLAALLGVLLASCTLLAGAQISLGVDHALAAGTGRLGADLMVVPAGAAGATHTALVMGEPVAFYMDDAKVRQVRAVTGVKQASPQLFVETLASSACCTGRLFLIGFDSATDFTVRPWLVDALGRDLAENEVVVGNHVVTPTGESMKFYGTDFTVAHRLDATGMGMDESVFLPVQAIWNMATESATRAELPLEVAPGKVSAIMVQVEQPQRAADVARAIQNAVPGITVVVPGQVAAEVGRDLRLLMAWLLPLAGGAGLVSLLVLLILFAAVAAERTREIGLLRAMGATAGQAVRVLVVEAALLGGAGGLLGTVAALVAVGLFGRALQAESSLPYLAPAPGTQLALSVGVVAGAAALAALAVAYPALRVCRLDPHEAIYGGARARPVGVGAR